ncbi:GHKL domain-containing protein [Ancylomarina longa]|uniref:histidine kinase n=2 Tax=Ancylomarina longa TaxID=2487017 RepID=A0A434AG97_9BACT|nr:GHKL domain-containing protein [Ancylomarina longa]
MLVFFVLAISSDYFFNRKDNLSHLAKKAQSAIWNKESKLEKSLILLQQAVLDPENTIQKNAGFSFWEEELKKEEFVLLAYRQDSAFFWSDNAFIIPSKKNLEKHSEGLYKCDDGWYLLQKRSIDSIDLYGFLLVKKIYPYQNKFLKSHYADYLSFSPKISLKAEPGTGVPILNRKGDFLFALQQVDIDYLEGGQDNSSALFYGLFLFFGLLFGSFIILQIREIRLGLIAVFLWGIILFLLRYLMLFYQFPAVFSSHEVFSPDLFASSFFFPSLGDFAINVIFLFVFIYTYTFYSLRNKIYEKLSKFWFSLWIGIHFVLFLLLYHFVSNWFLSLILDSSISFQMYTFQHNGLYVALGFFIITILFYALGIFANLIARIANKHWSFRRIALFVFILLVAYSGLEYFIGEPKFKFLLWVFPFGLLLIMVYINYREEGKNRYSLIVLLLLLVAIWITNQINTYSEIKEKQDRMVAAMNLSTEYDSTSENLLVDLQNDLTEDSNLQKLCEHPFEKELRIMDYIHSKYFKGYWEQYNVQVTICGHSDDLTIEPDNQIQNCFEFFEEMIAESGQPIPGTNFYSLNEFDGMVSYLGILDAASVKGDAVKIYLRLDSKIGSEGRGYPQLLLDEKVDLRLIGGGYSYGKYRKGKLIASSGHFNYFMSSKAFGSSKKNIFWKTLDGYDHLIYKFDDNTVVVSIPTLTWYNKMITVPYVFVLLYLLGLILWLIRKYPWQFRLHASFKYRIQYAIIGLLMLFFLLLGGGTVYYTINQTKQANNRILQDKLSIVKREVLSNFQENVDVDLLTDHLRQLSSLIYADIHLYDIHGDLISSSRPEIFEKKLQNKKMNFAAYYQLFFKKRTTFFHQENIGKMSYLSAYETLVDENNNIVAFINLPYFLKSQELEKEMFNLILAGVNLHVFMILLAIFISVFISNKITKPLRIIQNRLKATRFGSYSEQIEYSKNDEIGSLVKEYNQMLLELEESANLLARSERESAWREMARQIAHEIKNPLTPMKLSLQFLQKRLEEKSENWEDHFTSVSTTLIEQINALSAIASSFSNFAKMPLARNEKLNLVEVLQHVISLFRNDDLDLQLQLNNLDSAWVFVDREQFVRVFVNLINNAIQSIPEDRKAQVVMELEDAKNTFKISVIDNGIGIEKSVEEKLFYPNFTTKSSGMGLGLAIVKNIVENANGKIWVESEQDVGSCFFIQIPKYIKNVD